MGRIFNTTDTPIQPQGAGGRIFGGAEKSQQFLDDYIAPKSWENMSFGEKVWGVAQEVPRVIYNFLPPTTREQLEKPPEKLTSRIGGGFKGAAEFGLGIAEVTKQAIGGGLLTAKKQIVGGAEDYTIPGFAEAGGIISKIGAPHVGEEIAQLGEISSWGVQKKRLEEQGFTSDEAGSLVGINAYLGIVPFAAKGLRIEAGKRIVGRVFTKEVPFAETPEGIKTTLTTEAKPIIPPELEPLAQEARKYKSAEEFVDSFVKGDFVRSKIGDQRGIVIGEGMLGKDIPSLKIEMGGGKISAIPKENAELINRGGFPKFRLTDFYNQAVRGTEEITVEKPPVRIERPIITGVKRIFGKTEEQQKFNQLLESHLDKYFEGREAILGREDPLNQALLKLTDEELKTYSSVTQGLTTLAKPSENLKTAIELWRKTNQEIEADLIARGKLTKEQVENRRWKPIETITGRSRNELQEMGIEPVYYPYLAEDLLKKSDFISATGQRTKGGYLKRFTGKMLAEDSYIKNPKIAIPRNRMQVFRDKMNSELVETLRDNFAEIDKTIIKKYKTDPKFADQMGVEEWKPSGSLRFYPIAEEGIKKAVGVTKKVESYWIPKDVAQELNRFYRPGVLEKTLRMTYDPLIDMWRISVLNLAPRWLYNNMVGNVILSVLGRTDPVAFAKSFKELFARTIVGEKFGIGKREIPAKVFQKRYAGGELPETGKLGGLPREQTQFLRPIENWLNLLEQAKNYRALRIPAILTQNLIRGWIALGKPLGKLNNVIENWFRGAVYISKTEGKFLGLQVDKPVPPAEGLNYVNEFLFDYSKLTRAERATFRRALPFWNWMKNITEFSFKFPTKHPLRGLIVGALLQDYVDYINEINQAEDKTKSILRIKTNMTYEGKPLYLNVKSAIPFSDVFRTLPTNFEAFGRFLTSNPVSKLIIERAFRINSFTGQPFTQPKALQEFDEFGKPILPLPSVPRHLGQQIPQVKLGEQISETLRFGKPLKRFETGEPKVFHRQIQTEDWLFPILRMFGISLSAIELNKIKQQTERKERRQEVKKKQFERQVETGLQRLKANR